MKAYTTDHFVLPLPAGHRFPLAKYEQLRRRVVKSGIVAERDLLVPAAATDRDLSRAHAASYVRRVVCGELTPAEVRRIGFPWSPELVERSRRSCGATLEACRTALQEGVGINLAGGTHHARRDRGEGFCVFNDSAVAALALRSEGLLRRIAIVDCDVHQGDGTASIFAGDPDVFTLSVHCRANYPFEKECSDIDVSLDPGTGDAEYLRALEGALERVFSLRGTDLVVYLAGADPYKGDRLGRLALTKDGLAERDRLVLGRCRRAGLPVAIAMAGGYAPYLKDTVDIHFRTVCIAAGHA